MSVNSVDVKELIDSVVNSDTFKNWDKDDNYLVNCFFVSGIWTVGFYSKKSGKITSFVVGDSVEIQGEEEVFQDEKSDLDELEVDNVKIPLEDVIEKVNEIKNKKAEAESVTSRIIILHQKENPIWNITYTTSGFNILNVKIDACTGEILKESLTGIMSLKKN